MDYLDLTPYMLRMTRARPDRLRVTVYVAPGRADDLVRALHGRDIHGWAHSDSTVRIEDPLSVRELYVRTGNLIGAQVYLDRYVELRSFLKPGQKRAPDLTRELEAVIGQILEVQGD